MPDLGENILDQASIGGGMGRRRRRPAKSVYPAGEGMHGAAIQGYYQGRLSLLPEDLARVLDAGQHGRGRDLEPIASAQGRMQLESWSHVGDQPDE